MTEPEIRRLRLTELLLEELKSIIPLEMHDPRVVYVHVSRIFLSSDMKSCRAVVTVSGSREEKQAALRALEGATHYIRQELSIRLNLKYTPRLIFILENSNEEVT